MRRFETMTNRATSGWPRRLQHMLGMSFLFCVFGFSSAAAQDEITLSAKNCSVKAGDEDKVSFTSGNGGYVWLNGNASTTETATLHCSIPYAHLFLCGAPSDDVRLKVRYLDGGADSVVSVSIYHYDIDNGAGSPQPIFLSNNHTQSSGFRTRSVVADQAGNRFCDSTRAYYARVELSRNGQSIDPAFGALRISLE